MWNRVSWGGPSRLWPWGYFWPHGLTFEVLLSSRYQNLMCRLPAVTK